MRSLKPRINIPFGKYFSLLNTYLRPQMLKLSGLIILILTSTALTVINPQILRYYIDTVMNQQITDISGLTTAALLYIGIAILAQILLIISVYLGQDLAWTSTNNLRYDLLDHCLNLDMGFHNQHKPGSMVERIDGDVLMLSTFFSTLTLYLGRNILLIVAILLALFLENLIIGGVFTTFTIIGLFFMMKSSKPAIKEWGKVREATSDTYGYIEERIAGKEDVLALGGERYVMKGFHQKAKTQYDAGMKAMIKSSYVRIVIFGIVGVSTTLVYTAGVPLVLQGVISLGGIFLIADYVRLINNPITNIGFQAQELQRADASIDRVQELFNITKNLKDEGTERISQKPLSITFEDVSFEYKQNEPVLKNISLHLEEHSSIGLIGRTGSGKTTLSRLIFRLYDPQNGRIIIDGRDIREYPLKELRDHIAVVTQTVELFNGTLRDNITLFNPNISDEMVIEVMQKVGLETWLKRLKHGLDTQIDAGNGFSAGEAQLIAFTRVFLRDPQIVILDEASSRLDPATEILVDRATRKLLENRTSIIIAHRLSTLNHVDSIAILQDGEIIETGERSLLENDTDSTFSKLLVKDMVEVLV
ncbi:MAG: ABC transporter ATP-binding protein [Candidatus Heimdallarchaeota archaeon]|nr:ABC transporter ATP-binding protein [Candidatus Heimdallarchaeota archaeon]